MLFLLDSGAVSTGVFARSLHGDLNDWDEELTFTEAGLGDLGPVDCAKIINGLMFGFYLRLPLAHAK